MLERRENPVIPPIPVGAIKTLGPFGVLYEVNKPLRPLSGGDWIVEIVLVETGERAKYYLSDINKDPEAN